MWVESSPLFERMGEEHTHLFRSQRAKIELEAVFSSVRDLYYYEGV
jgi:hypothetical protein